MKTLLGLLLLAGCAYAQSPATTIRRGLTSRTAMPGDSLPSAFRPGESTPDIMPTVRPNNSFYRHQSDPKNVMRATLDNMPVKVPDSSTNYTMMRLNRTYLIPDEPPTRFLKPLPKIVPKKR